MSIDFFSVAPVKVSTENEKKKLSPLHRWIKQTNFKVLSKPVKKVKEKHEVNPVTLTERHVIA